MVCTVFEKGACSNAKIMQPNKNSYPINKKPCKVILQGFFVSKSYETMIVLCSWWFVTLNTFWACIEYKLNKVKMKMILSLYILEIIFEQPVYGILLCVGLA